MGNLHTFFLVHSADQMSVWNNEWLKSWEKHSFQLSHAGIPSSYADVSQAPFYTHTINNVLPVNSQKSKGLCWIQFAMCVCDCHAKQGIQLIICLLHISVTARRLHMILAELIPWPLFPPHPHAGAPATPARRAVTSCCHPGKVQAVPQSPGFIRASLLCVSLPSWAVLKIEKLQSTEGAGQETYPESGPNSAKLHFIGQICLMLPGHKLEGKCTLQCLQLGGVACSIFQTMCSLCWHWIKPFLS